MPSSPRAAVTVLVAVAPDVWSAKVNVVWTAGSAEAPWLASTAVTPSRVTGLSTAAVAVAPGGVGSAGGVRRTVRSTT